MGARQAEAIILLNQFKQWFEGCGWNYGSPSSTKRMMESLVKQKKAVAKDEVIPIKGTTRVYKALPTAASTLPVLERSEAP